MKIEDKLLTNLEKPNIVKICPCTWIDCLSSVSLCQNKTFAVISAVLYAVSVGRTIFVVDQLIS